MTLIDGRSDTVSRSQCQTLEKERNIIVKIYVGQIEVGYRYNPLGRYYNLWFYRHNKCIFTATLFKSEFIVEALHEVGEQLIFGRLQSYKAWNPDTHELVIEGVYE